MDKKEKLAYQLFLSISVGINVSFDKIIKMVIDDKDLNKTIQDLANTIYIQFSANGYTNFRDTLKMIVELCTPADTLYKKNLLSKAYSWLGADYRKLAINASKDYLQHDSIYNNDDIYPLFKDGQEVTSIDSKHYNTYFKLLDYSKALEGEYEFNKALLVLKKADHLFPYDYCIHAKIFNVLRKMNQLDLIIDIINECLSQEWAKPCFQWNELKQCYYFNDRNQRALLCDLKKYTNLKKRGYVYKPRKKFKKNNSSNIYDDSRQLKELLDMGIITQEEFDQKKKELLDL